MASIGDDRSKPVTGYPAQPGYVATGYPQAALPASSAYPYAAPPPYAFTAPFHHRLHAHRQDSFLCRLFGAMLTVFLIISFIFFIVWLVFRPRLPDFRVASASVSPINATAAEMTATWDISVLVTNPNGKISIFYDRLEASVFYGDFLLSQTELRPFDQAKKDQSSVHARLAVVQANVGYNVVSGISGDRDRGSVTFGFRFIALVRFKSGVWRTRKNLMQVDCEGVNFGYSSKNMSGTLLNPSKECRVGL